MKIYKKFISILLLICIALTIGGCNNNAEKQETIEKTVPLEDKEYEYAKLAILKGIGLKEGMTLLIEADVECYEFARICTEVAYECGAKEVILSYSDENAKYLKYAYADDEAFSKYHEYKNQYYKELYEEKIAELYLYSTFPNLYDNLSDEQLYRPSSALYEYVSMYDNACNNNEISWCIVGVPNELWATTVFPDLDKDEAILKLWNAVLDTVMVNGNNDSLETWTNHIEELNSRANTLNKYNFKTLHYTNSLGTDLTIDLSQKALWKSAFATTPDGISFIANMPTEEIYTAPICTSANGTICSSMPLNLNGTIVKDIKFTVESGKIINAEASSGLDILNTYLDVDEGSRYFGEISLVPYDSPISNTGILFYNTLYDENASCHIAFGSAYPECLEGGELMSDEELSKEGINISNTHIDFMIGTSDLKVVGTTYNNEEIVIFENGNFSKNFQ